MTIRYFVFALPLALCACGGSQDYEGSIRGAWPQEQAQNRARADGLDQQAASFEKSADEAQKLSASFSKDSPSAASQW